MEKTKFGPATSGANGTDHPGASQPNAPQQYSIQDPATGKSRPVREMTDEEIARNMTIATDVHRQQCSHMQQQIADIQRALANMQATLGSVMGASAMTAVLGYEQARRKVSLKIAN